MPGCYCVPHQGGLRFFFFWVGRVCVVMLNPLLGRFRICPGLRCESGFKFALCRLSKYNTLPV